MIHLSQRLYKGLTTGLGMEQAHLFRQNSRIWSQTPPVFCWGGITFQNVAPGRHSLK